MLEAMKIVAVLLEAQNADWRLVERAFKVIEVKCAILIDYYLALDEKACSY